MTASSRPCIVSCAILLASCAHAPHAAIRSTNSAAANWYATWAPSQSATAARPAVDSLDRVPTYTNATIRQIVRTSIGGDQVRIHISNEYGDRPIMIGGAHIALRQNGSTIVGSSDRPLTFGGSTSVVVRPGAVIASDPLTYTISPLTDLAVSLYLPTAARTTTRHALAVQTTYISKQGNQLSSATFASDTTLRSWIFLSAVDVHNPNITGTIVTVGNSITDGLGATVDANKRWPDVLAARLLSSKTEPVKAVINAGISGNRVLTFGSGPSLLARFDRDVLMQPGVTHVIVLEGINDISRSTADSVTVEDIIFGHKQVIARAHERGILMYGATLTAFERAPAANEAKRQSVNQWIRTSGAYDAVIDFDAITRDPTKPTRLLPAYDSGDSLHPSDAGYKAMGEAIDLALFRGGLRR